MGNDNQTIHKRKKGVPEQWQILSVLMAVYDFIAIHGAFLLALLARFDFKFSEIPNHFWSSDCTGACGPMPASRSWPVPWKPV